MTVNGIDFFYKNFGLINKGKPIHYLIYNEEKKDYEFQSCSDKSEAKEIVENYEFVKYTGLETHKIPNFRKKNEDNTDSE